jgi:hypothetical protein
VPHRCLALLASLLVLATACRADGPSDPSGAPTASPITPTTSSTAPTATPTATPTPASAPPAGPVLDAAALPTGAPPRVAYAVSPHPTFGGGDWRLVRPGGATQPFGHVPALFAAYDDVVVNGFGTEAGLVVQLWAGDGSSVRELPPLCHFAVVSSPDRDQVAWLEEDSLVSVSSDGSVSTRPVRLPDGPCGADEPVAVNGPDLYVNGPKVAPSVVSGPGEPVRIPQLSELVDVSRRGNLVGRLRDEDACWGLLRADGQQRWRTCADRLVSFAPDGKHVLGTRGRAGDAGFDGLVVHGPRNGRVEAQWADAPHQQVSQVEWEDAGHLLVVVRNAAVGWSVVRLGLEDGSAEYAVAPVRTGAEFPPFRLPMS